MLEVYDFDFSVCSIKVRMVLAEKNIPWHRRRVDLLAFDTKTPDYLELNPQGVVPTVRTEQGAVLTETDVIIQYLDESYGGRTLSPPEPLERARMRGWLRTIENVHTSYGTVLYDQVLLPYWRSLDAERFALLLKQFAISEWAVRIEHLVHHGISKDRVARALADLKQIFDRIDRDLTDKAWLIDGEYSLADISLLPYVDSRLRVISQLWNHGGTNLERWLSAMHERPSYAAAVASYKPAADVEPFFVETSATQKAL